MNYSEAEEDYEDTSQQGNDYIDAFPRDAYSCDTLTLSSKIQDGSITIPLLKMDHGSIHWVSSAVKKIFKTNAEWLGPGSLIINNPPSQANLDKFRPIIDKYGISRVDTNQNGGQSQLGTIDPTKEENIRNRVNTINIFEMHKHSLDEEKQLENIWHFDNRYEVVFRTMMLR